MYRQTVPKPSCDAMNTQPHKPVNPEITYHKQLTAYLEAENFKELTVMLDSLPLSDALREILTFSSDERDKIFSVLPSGFAAELIREAPSEIAGELIERLHSGTAAQIIDELD